MPRPDPDDLPPMYEYFKKKIGSTIEKRIPLEGNNQFIVLKAEVLTLINSGYGYPKPYNVSVRFTCIYLDNGKNTGEKDFGDRQISLVYLKGLDPFWAELSKEVQPVEQNDEKEIAKKSGGFARFLDENRAPGK